MKFLGQKDFPDMARGAFQSLEVDLTRPNTKQGVTTSAVEFSCYPTGGITFTNNAINGNIVSADARAATSGVYTVRIKATDSNGYIDIGKAGLRVLEDGEYA